MFAATLPLRGLLYLIRGSLYLFAANFTCFAATSPVSRLTLPVRGSLYLYPELPGAPQSCPELLRAAFRTSSGPKPPRWSKWPVSVPIRTMSDPRPPRWDQFGPKAAQVVQMVRFGAISGQFGPKAAQVLQMDRFGIIFNNFGPRRPGCSK